MQSVFIGSGAGVGAPASLPFAWSFYFGLLARRVYGLKRRRTIDVGWRGGGTKVRELRGRWPRRLAGLGRIPFRRPAPSTPASWLCARSCRVPGSAGAWRQDLPGVWRGGAVGA